MLIKRLFYFFCFGYFFMLDLDLVASREYIFPMCPNKSWEIPGGKIHSGGEVHYFLKCSEHFTGPFLGKANESFICQPGNIEALPKRCVHKIFARVTLEYGIRINISHGRDDICKDTTLENTVKSINFEDSQAQNTKQAWPSMVTAEIKNCMNMANDAALMKIHITNVLVGNGTADEVRHYYKLIVSGTFKVLKTHIETRSKSDVKQKDIWKPQDMKILRRVRRWDRNIDINSKYPDIRARVENRSLWLNRNKTTLRNNIPSYISQRMERVWKVRQAFTRVYEGLEKVGDGSVVVGHFCPPHLELIKIDGINGAKDQHLCVGCGKGWILAKDKINNVSKCFPCGPGYYNDLETATECKPCPIKYSTAPWDAISLDNCNEINMSEADKRKWTLFGYAFPYLTFIAVSLGVVWASTLTKGPSTKDSKERGRRLSFKSQDLSQKG